MKSILFIAATILLSFVACTPMKMAVHPDLQSAYDEFPVKGRQGILIKQKMSFGEFNTNTVKRSWTRGSNAFSGLGYVDQQRMKWVNLIGTEYINRKQTVRFSLNNQGMQSDVYCVSKYKSEDFRIGARENSIVNIGLDIWGVGDESSSLYYVQIFAGKEEKDPWQLVLDNQESQQKPGKYIGKLLKNEKEFYTLHPVRQMESKGKVRNMPFGSIGFEFRNPGGKTVAAVSMIDKGMVYLGKTTAEERFLLANACTAILLQEQIG
jgi:hypothetical protein